MSEDHDSAFGAIDERRAPCPECEKETRVNTLFERIERWSDDGDGIQGVEEYYAFQCRGCEALFFARSSGNSEDYYIQIDHYTGEEECVYIDNKQFWPSVPHTPTPSWAGFDLSRKDETLHELVHNIYKCLNNDMPIMAAIGMRTAFDRISEILGVNTGLSFSDKLEELRKNGYISGLQKGLLEILIDAGSAAAHRGWKPEKKHLATMREILESLIRDHFVLPDEIAELKKSVPKKNSK